MQFWPHGQYMLWRDRYFDNDATLDNIRDHFRQVYILCVGHEPTAGKLKKGAYEI